VIGGGVAGGCPAAGSEEHVSIVTIRNRKGQRGYNIVELMIAMAITTAMIAIVFSMIEEAMTLSLFVESHNDLTTMSQKALNSVQTEIVQARTIFTEDAVGTPYRQKIEALLPACAYPCASNVWKLPAVANTQLPEVDPAGTLAPDPAGTRYTGNAVLVARQLQPVSIPIIADGAGFPAFTFFADRYRFEYFYLTYHGSPSHRFFRDGDHILDLWQVRTIEYADYYQLLNATVNMSANQKIDLSNKIRSAAAGSPNLQTAWDPGQVLTSAFYTIDANLSFAAGAIATFQFKSRVPDDLASGGSLMPALLGGRIGGKMDYTVAYVKSRNADPTLRLLDRVPLNETRTDGRNPLPQYALVAGTLPLDCGFEVKVTGPAGARQVLTRLVMYANYRASKVDSTEAFVITSFTRT